MDDLIRLWGTGAISSCLVLSPGVTRPVYSGLEIKSPIGNVAGSVDSELIGFYLKSTSWVGGPLPRMESGEWGIPREARNTQLFGKILQVSL